MINFLISACITLVAPASQPTSHATSQPAAPRPDERVVEDATLHFHFAVPKSWKAVPQKVDSVYVFQLPATGDARRIAPSLIVTARDAGSDELAKEVDARRDAIQQRNAGVKFDEDVAATVAGHDGWTFAYATKLNQTVTEQLSGKQHQEQVAIQVRDQLVLDNGRFLEFVITSDDKGLLIRRKLMERAISTVVVE